MQFKSVKRLIGPLLKKGQYWQTVSISGVETKPKYYFSDVQWVLLLISTIVLLKLSKGISKEIIGYVI
ncbi:MAG: hypothetical protein JWP27_847, partial [Flaviaesturariibacter sp.]|nr:hypothetical protein [Flaviaesturariibacter sp.]